MLKNQMLRLVAGGWIAMASTVVSAANPTPAQIEVCSQHIDQRNAAIRARDMASLEKSARAYIRQCDKLDPPHMLAQAHWEAGFAVKWSNPVKAVKAFDTCLRINYENASCHSDRIFALIRLQRKDEARRSLKSAVPLVGAQLEAIERTLAEGASAEEKEAIELNRELLHAYVDAFELYTRQLQ